MVEYKDVELTSPTNTSKIHLHVEQFSQKTNWKLAEDLLYTKAERKVST